jgi:hypothetical protein
VYDFLWGVVMNTNLKLIGPNWVVHICTSSHYTPAYRVNFAHCLEQHCRKHDLIPQEQSAKSKTICEEGTIIKNLICDGAQILHNSLGITEADMDQCFNRGVGPVV